MKLADISNGPDWVVWVAFIIFAIISVGQWELEWL